MQPPTCDVCGIPAVVRDTVVRNGAPVVRHLCRAHGLPVWRNAVDVVADGLERSLAKEKEAQSVLLLSALSEFRRQASHSDG